PGRTRTRQADRRPGTRCGAQVATPGQGRRQGSTAIRTLTCNRRLTPASKIQLVYGQGVSTPSGVPNSVEKRYNFQVREPFSASFNCERENAQSACLPIRPMSLNFNAPVPRKLAEAIRLKSAKDTLKPVFDTENGD